MKYGDRCAFMDPEVMDSHWRRYKDHLRSVGIQEDEPVYSYFVCEHFHDSEIIVRNVDMSAKTVTLAMYDIMWMDQITARNMPDKFSREDFLTEVHFKGVTTFFVDIAGMRGKTEHYLSELDRKDGKTSLTMYIRGENVHDRTGKMVLEYSEIQIEDIGPKLDEKYYPHDDRAEQ